MRVIRDLACAAAITGSTAIAQTEAIEAQAIEWTFASPSTMASCFQPSPFTGRPSMTT